MPEKIAVLIGSLRRQSFNRKMAENLIRLAPSSLEFEILEIGHLPLYNQDLDDHPPQEWVEFKRRVNDCDGVLFVTPEYNRSVPGVLKNAIDIASRPYGQSAWKGKPAAVISVSPGSIGGFGANHHLRQSLVFLDMPVMQQPEAYIGKAASLFGETDELIDESVEKFAENFINAFAEWVERISPGKTVRRERKAS